MTCYLRFFHFETGRFSFLTLESLITMAVLAVCLFAPVHRGTHFPGRRFKRFALHRRRACVVVFLCSLVGRVALLPIEPFPQPNVHDEFAYLLASDTFAHGRLTNPTPPAWHHFEAFYVLMQPTYASKYGAALPVFLAAGQRWLGSPRSGLVISMALAAASLCWMLQAVVPAEWALVGGLLAVVRMSWFSYFGNAYWGGSAALLGGCLLLGAALRMSRRLRVRDGIVFALGLLLLANCRPFEGGIMSLCACVWTMRTLIRERAPARIWLPGAGILLAGAALTAFYFYRVAGQLMFPWVVYWRAWSITPPFFFGQPNHSPHYQFADQAVFNNYWEILPYYRMRSAGTFCIELAVKFLFQWLFFIFPALLLPLIGLVPTLRSRKCRMLTWTLAVAIPGFLTETWLQAHYVAVIGGIVYVILVNGLRWMHALGRQQPVWLSLLRGTVAAVLVMLVVRLIIVPRNTYPPNWASQTGDIPAYEDMHRIIEAKPGNHLVIVRYRPGHEAGYSWINNGYDIPGAKVLWVRDTEPEESNGPLLCAFRGRQVWLLIPPETGWVRPPDRTVAWDFRLAERFLSPYPVPRELGCE